MDLGSIRKIKFYHLDHYKLITRKTGMKLVGNQVKRIRKKATWMGNTFLLILLMQNTCRFCFSNVHTIDTTWATF